MPDNQDHLELASHLVRRALRFWAVGLVVLLAGGGLTAAARHYLPKSYRSEAVILYRAGVTAGDPALQAETDGPRQVIARLTELLTARTRLESLVREQGLYPRLLAESGPADAVEEMRKHLGVTVREGLSFRLTFEAESPELARSVLARLVDSAIAEDGRLRRERAKQAEDFFDARKKEIEDELRTREAALSGFLSQHPELAVEANASASKAGATVRGNERLRAGADPMNRLSLQIQAAQLADSIAAARKNAQPRVPFSDRPSAAAVAEQAYLTAQQELADAQAKYTPVHPTYQSAERKVTETQAALARANAEAAARPVVEAPTTDSARSAAESVATLERTLQMVKDQMAHAGTVRAPAPPAGGVPRAARLETEWARLAREVDEARDRRDLLETRQFQANISAELIDTGESGKVVVIDAPYRPIAPVPGRSMKVATLGGGGTLLLATLLMVLLGLRDDRLHGPREVRAVLGPGPLVLRLTGLGSSPV
jgi:uncharacterized protein involved in exopolysaccharide biosynthesis